jgi:hypothetical protein
MSGSTGRHIFSTFNATAGSLQIISVSCFYGTCHKHNTTPSVPQPYILREPTQKTVKSSGLLKASSRIRILDSVISEREVDAVSSSHDQSLPQSSFSLCRICVKFLSVQQARTQAIKTIDE